jgi:CheY-like chemotaxis protein
MPKVLIIEDEATTVEMIRSTLAELPTRGELAVAEAPTMHRGLELVKALPDLIILDMYLAENTTGTAFMVFYHRMVKSGTLPEIPVILMSSMNLPELENLQVTYPSIKELLQKPIEHRALYVAIAHCLKIPVPEDEAKKAPGP